ncbi:endoplasmic reticulum retention protein [Thoreauomyces humboldtii]|nr:endoplasmic reticulum retention protein [Thoreauomyces humboldtii]
MNIFRLIGDLLHLASIIMLLLKITRTRSAAGISLNSQILYALVFVSRYLDLFVHWVSLYNTLMKLVFIASSCYIIYLMKVTYRATWDPSIDTVRIEYLVAPAAVLAILFHHGKASDPALLKILQTLWSFSIYLESVAILPQLFQLTRTGEADAITTHYLFALGGYRALYICNYLLRFHLEGRVDWIPVVAGVVQTALYADFFYVYVTRVLKGKKFVLPA